MQRRKTLKSGSIIIGMKAINKTGRPTSLNPDTVAKLCEALRLGSSIQTACHYAKVNRSTFYRHLETDGDFATKIEAARDYLIMVALAVVYKAIVVDRDVRIAMWWLEKKDLEFSGKMSPQMDDGVPIIKGMGIPAF